MKLKVAILHKEHVSGTYTYKVYVTKHRVKVDNDRFDIKKLHMSFLAPQPKQDIMLLDDKWILYTDVEVTPFNRDWKPTKVNPLMLRMVSDESWIRNIIGDVYLNSFWSYLSNMLKSWFSKFTFKKENNKCDTVKNAEDSSYNSNEEDAAVTVPSINVQPADKSTNKHPAE